MTIFQLKFMLAGMEAKAEREIKAMKDAKAKAKRRR